MFAKTLHLPDNFTRVIRHTRTDGENILLPESRGKKVEKQCFMWALGHEVARKDDNFIWNTWTVENQTHKGNFKCVVTSEGKLVGKIAINCFVLGWMLERDQEYVDTLLKEIKERGGIEWDVVESEENKGGEE